VTDNAWGITSLTQPSFLMLVTSYFRSVPGFLKLSVRKPVRGGEEKKGGFLSLGLFPHLPF